MTTEKVEEIVVLSGKTARALLREGYTITDVKPDRNNAGQTVFVFKVEKGIREVMFNNLTKARE